MTDSASLHAAGRRRLQVAAFTFGLVVFPLTKVHVVTELAVVRRFHAAGDRAGWRLLWATYLGFELVAVGLCWAALLPSDRRRQLRLAASRQRVWWTALAGVGVVTAIVVALRHSGALELTADHPATEFLDTSAVDTAQRLALLASAIVAVACEEAIFRGFAIPFLLERRVTPWVAIAVPAVSFGYLHGGVTSVAGAVQTILVAGAAIGLGWLYRRTESLLPGYVLHLSWTLLFIAFTPT